MNCNFVVDTENEQSHLALRVSLGTTRHSAALGFALFSGNVPTAVLLSPWVYDIISHEMRIRRLQRKLGGSA